MSKFDLLVKSKRQRTSSRKWSIEETQIILNYLTGTIRRNMKIEKPTACTYYRHLMSNWPEEYKLCSDITPDLLKNKVRNLRQSYLKTKNWTKYPGLEVKETQGEQIFTEILLKMCPNYFQCAEIWKEESNIIHYSAGGNSVQSRKNNSMHETNGNEIEVSDLKEIPESAEEVVVSNNEEHGLTAGRRPVDNSQIQDDCEDFCLRNVNVETKERKGALKREQLNVQKEELAIKRRKIELDAQFEREKFEYQKQKDQQDLAKERLRIRYKELELAELKIRFEMFKAGIV